jgi:hypothetical protein
VGGIDRVGAHGGRRFRPVLDLVDARRNASAAGGRKANQAAADPQPLLAAIGLVVWIVYLVNDSEALAWLAFAILAVVAVLGWTMFAIWARRRQAETSGAEGAAPGRPAEQHFPVPIVALHGVGAVTTVVLVLLTALGIGG